MTSSTNSFVADIPCDLLLVSGKDSQRFLQGQLSCDMNRLSGNTRLRGALCNLKGRVISDVQLWQHEDNIIMQCPQGMAEKIRSSLSKYQVFFKTDIETMDARFQCIGVSLSDPGHSSAAEFQNWPGDIDQVINLPGLKVARINNSTSTPARFELLLDSGHDKVSQWLSTLAGNLRQGQAVDWRLFDIQDGIAHVRPGQEECFTPQLLGYDLNGTIDFKKGCYTGQEVVARMYYRAEAKKRPGYLLLEQGESLDNFGIEADNDIIDMVETPDGKRHYLLVANTRDEQRHSRIELIAG
ncbi:YgfZ/GcvT domain-containing protein [Pseudohongiella spirulinae]|uniref:Uncharacterized protein n=1 Tax=Pseudohongiella spirulinae TaxID=1249552 RepID=A0A0S2KD72_9GAMM|nr:folate-binding protein YgfZ [Pseudohongiella spirulinae]ALO46257.1 hypothetical protein PS2015_1604 [Pseudohongiella spirulinae]